MLNHQRALNSIIAILLGSSVSSQCLILAGTPAIAGTRQAGKATSREGTDNSAWRQSSDGLDLRTGCDDPREWGRFNPDKFKPEYRLVPSAAVAPRKVRLYRELPAFPHDPSRNNLIFGLGPQGLPTEIYAKAYDVLQLGGKYFQAPAAGETKQLTISGQSVTVYGTTWYTPLKDNRYVGNPAKVTPFDPTRIFYKDRSMWPTVIYAEAGKPIVIAGQTVTVPEAGKSVMLSVTADGKIKLPDQSKESKSDETLASAASRGSNSSSKPTEAGASSGSQSESKSSGEQTSSGGTAESVSSKSASASSSAGNDGTASGKTAAKGMSANSTEKAAAEKAAAEKAAAEKAAAEKAAAEKAAAEKAAAEKAAAEKAAAEKAAAEKAAAEKAAAEKAAAEKAAAEKAAAEKAAAEKAAAEKAAAEKAAAEKAAAEKAAAEKAAAEKAAAEQAAAGNAAAEQAAAGNAAADKAASDATAADLAAITAARQSWGLGGTGSDGSATTASRAVCFVQDDNGLLGIPGALGMGTQVVVLPIKRTVCWYYKDTKKPAVCEPNVTGTVKGDINAPKIDCDIGNGITAHCVLATAAVTAFVVKRTIQLSQAPPDYAFTKGDNLFAPSGTPLLTIAYKGVNSLKWTDAAEWQKQHPPQTQPSPVRYADANGQVGSAGGDSSLGSYSDNSGTQLKSANEQAADLAKLNPMLR